MSYNTTLASPAFLPLLFLFEGELFFGHSHLLTSEVWKGKQWYQRRVRGGFQVCTLRGCPFFTMSSSGEITYLSRTQARNLDQDLVTSQGFGFDVLMELAGLSVAQAIAHTYHVGAFKNVLIVAGPGNNGGDGFVCARHLTHFGYHVNVVYPKPVNRPPFNNLVTQIRNLNIPLSSDLPEKLDKFDLIVDAIFGFSFQGTVRYPFDGILQTLRQSSVPIASIDVPSGWDVENGNESGAGLEPEFLISLTAPKLMAKFFKGKYHFLGGRFVPPQIMEKYCLSLPSYPAYQQFGQLNVDLE
eukprot:TRINITY_DN1906_c0_g1_i7.p1 TRINITY_DN1906_c0_g1~~TRINITY_DN1906_c0_g1_i7.p1  ORF type:complete len:299 (+),score=62.45 TRINITY_DN1906_c0_g1_i7:67-963(+)